MKQFLVFALSILLVLSPAGLPAATQVDIVLNGSTLYVPMANSLPWSSFNQTYVMTPATPSTGVCIFLTNDNPSQSHTFAVAMFQTGNPTLNSYDGFTQFWNPVTIFNSPIRVNAGSTVSFFANTTAAAEIAVQFTGASAAGSGSPDTAELFLVQSTAGTCGSASAAIAVQGTAAIGTPISGNPVLVGGEDPTGKAQALPIDSNGNLQPGGVVIGEQTTSFQPTANLLRSIDGTPLWVAGAGIDVQNGLTRLLYTTSQTPFSLLTVDGGFIGNTTSSTITSSTSLAITPTILYQVVAFQGCSFALQVTGTVSGTTPTMNVFIQDSYDGTNWNDRVAFNQVTVTGNFQEAGITSAASHSPGAFTNGTLTAGTVVNGPVGTHLQAKFVTGGTSPSFGGTIVYAVCQ